MLGTEEDGNTRDIRTVPGAMQQRVSFTWPQALPSFQEAKSTAGSCILWPCRLTAAFEEHHQRERVNKGPQFVKGPTEQIKKPAFGLTTGGEWSALPGATAFAGALQSDLARTMVANEPWLRALLA
jgi:hypothetical protein